MLEKRSPTLRQHWARGAIIRPLSGSVALVGVEAHSKCVGRVWGLGPEQEGQSKVEMEEKNGS
jgi:hypothetical protein